MWGANDRSLFIYDDLHCECSIYNLQTKTGEKEMDLITEELQ